MKTIRTLIFILLLSFLWAGSASARMPIDDLTAKIQARYEETSDLKARFIQEAVLKTAKKTQIEEGIVYFKKPKRMLWDYTKPQSKKLVINPKTAWLYDTEHKMVYVQDSKNVFSSGQAIRFLAGIGKLRDEFDIKYAQTKADSSGNYLLEMIPKGGPEAAGGVRKLLATVDKDTYLITKVRFNDSLGNQTVISFHDLKTNIGMVDSMFTFKPPAGTEVQKVQ
jgi:outer membrane lipoprotein carrier protein